MDYHELFVEILKNDDTAKKLRTSNATVKINRKEINHIIESKIGEEFEEYISNLVVYLKKNSLVINSGWKKSNNEPIMVSVAYDQYFSHFLLESIPTWNEMENSAKLLSDSITDQITLRIKKLTQPQSEVLIENVLSYDKHVWIKDFKLSPTRNDDGGKDFTASLLIRENKKDIAFNGYGKMTYCIGQLKHLKKEMGPGDMRDFIGSIRNARKEYGIVISTNGYTEKAHGEAEKSGYHIFCFDAEFLAKLMVESKIGMRDIRIRGGKIPDEDWWNEIQLPS